MMMLQSEKTWYTMVLIGFLEVLVFIAYQFYTSITGQNVDLVKKIDDKPISSELGIEKLQMKQVLEGNILIQDSALD
jgi:hypothetical protein